MSASQIVKLFVGTGIAFFAIDLVWLGVIAPAFYQRHLGHLLAEQVRWVPAVLFYTVYIAGLLTFVIVPALQAGSLTRAVVFGALLGFFAYATFDLTCLALFKDFPAVVVVVDLIWGSTMQPIGSVLTLIALGWFIGRASVLEEVNRGSSIRIGAYWILWIRYVIPSVVLVVLISGWSGPLQMLISKLLS